MSGAPKNICWRHRPTKLLKRWWGSTRRRILRYHSSGRWGERIAKRFLARKGLIVLATNWRHTRLEADIIACDDRTIVIVEVKTRNARFKARLPAIGAITPDKHAHLAALGRRFMRNNGPLCRRFTLRKNRIDILEIYYRRSMMMGRRIEDIRWHQDFTGRNMEGS